MIPNRQGIEPPSEGIPAPSVPPTSNSGGGGYLEESAENFYDLAPLSTTAASVGTTNHQFTAFSASLNHQGEEIQPITHSFMIDKLIYNSSGLSNLTPLTPLSMNEVKPFVPIHQANHLLEAPTGKSNLRSLIAIFPFIQ